MLWLILPAAALLMVLVLAVGRVRVGRPGEPARVGPAPLDLKGEQEVRELAGRGEKIEAIKRLRDLTGMGLKEAKEFVEALPHMPVGSASTHLPKPPQETGLEEAEVRALVDGGRLIEAIKLVRAKTGLGLKEAKDYVDRLRTG